MAEKIMFIGFDLGDSESITDSAILDAASAEGRIKTTFIPMTMPGSNVPGQAIPTAYGYDKSSGALVLGPAILAAPDEARDVRANFMRRPGDLLGPVSRERLEAIEERLSVGVMEKRGAPNQAECPELFTDGMREFQEAVVTFVNAVFENPEYKAVVASQSINSGKVVFCVSHPAKWQPVDAAIYRLVLSASVLGKRMYGGKPCELILAAEPRVAFFYAKESHSFPADKEKRVLVINAGDSTVDVSALDMDTCRVEFNRENNRVGARATDFLIRDWYTARLAQDPNDWAALLGMLDMDKGLGQSLTLMCRMAKEQAFSQFSRKARIDFLPQFPPVTLTTDQVGRLASETPIGPVLKQYAGIPAAEADSMGRKTWTSLFREFIQECRARMEAENIHISRIILIGSAARMPFVREAVGEVYSELGDGAILEGINTARSISMGLVLVGREEMEAGTSSKAVRKPTKTEAPQRIEPIPDRLTENRRNFSMAEKITFIGYDLGDGESITDIAVLDDASVEQRIKTTFIPMTMPDSNTPGQAIPTAYGYDKNDGMLVFASSILVMPDEVRDIHINFKRRPGDLLGPVSQERLKAIEDRLSVRAMKEKGTPSQVECPELFTDGMRKFQEAVVTFTNAVFEDPKYKAAVVGQSMNSSKVVFCVGHPTKWQPLDVAIYRLVLSASVLGEKTYAGKPSEMILAAESRAAFLYVKNQGNSFSVDEGKSVLLIDVGSSTIDVSALTMDSRNVEFNSGNNYMGARSIDFLIRDWYTAHLAKDPADWSAFQEMLDLNRTLDQALTLECRVAKEKVFSLNAHKAKIDFLPQFPSLLLTMDQVGKLASEMPIGPVLKQYVGIPAVVADSMGKKTWTDLFREFIQECRVKMEAENIHISRIILTGSASQMPFVREVVRGVYSELGDDGILKDMNTSRSISMGLALVGPSAIMAESFREAVEALMQTDVPQCIGDNLPALADKLSKVIQNIVVQDIVKKHVRKWRRKEYTTLNDMTAAIKQACQQDRLAPLLENSKEYNQVIRDWMTDKVGADIAQRLLKICERFGVKGLTLNSLNVMKAPDINLGGLDFGPLDGILEAISNVISIIAGVVAAIILPTVLGVIIGIIMFISFDFAMLLLGLLVLIPGWGWTLLIGIAGLAVFAMIKDGLEGPKKMVAEKIQGWDLPTKARDLLTDEKVDEQMSKPDENGRTIADKIRAAILEDKSRAAIIKAVKENINEQVAKRADRIMYVL